MENKVCAAEGHQGRVTTSQPGPWAVLQSGEAAGRHGPGPQVGAAPRQSLLLPTGPPARTICWGRVASVSCPEPHLRSSICSSLPDVLPTFVPAPGGHSGPPRASQLSARSRPAGVRGPAPPLPSRRGRLRARPHSQVLKQSQPAGKVPALPRPLGRTAECGQAQEAIPGRMGAAVTHTGLGNLHVQSGVPTTSGSTVKTKNTSPAATNPLRRRVASLYQLLSLTAPRGLQGPPRPGTEPGPHSESRES